jgi:hypothetical protein
MQVQADVLSSLQLLREEHDEFDIADLASLLTSAGRSVKLRQAVGGGDNCFQNLNHEFLLVKVRHNTCMAAIRILLFAKLRVPEIASHFIVCRCCS